MPSSGSVTSDQVGAGSVVELGAVMGGDAGGGARFVVGVPAPAPTGWGAAPGLSTAVVAACPDAEHPAIVPTRRNAARTATGRCRRHRGGTVKRPTLGVGCNCRVAPLEEGPLSR
jgi:hypothetical protein